jgi:hypothetical protein
MRAIRAPHLRQMNRYQLFNVWLEGGARQWTLRAAGFGTKLATVTIPAGVAIDDVDRFFEAVKALVDTPAPEPRKRKKARR